MAKAKEEREKLLPTTRNEDIKRNKHEAQTHYTHQARRERRQKQKINKTCTNALALNNNMYICKRNHLPKSRANIKP